MKLKEVIKTNIEQVVDLKLLSRQWAIYLDNPSFDWCWYGHLTFKDFPHPESANKCFNKFINIINRASFGRNFYKDEKKGVTWSRGTEYQDRGSIHYHCLIGFVKPELNRFDFMRIWYQMAGLSRIYLFKRNKGAEYYMSKSCYAWKRGEIDLSDTMKFHV